MPQGTGQVTAIRRQNCTTCYSQQALSHSGLALKARVESLDESSTAQDAFTQELEALAAEVTGLLDGTSLYLIGMMGSGKSTVGKIVAGLLGYPYMDIDSLIEGMVGCTVAQIFSERGEQAFRDLESQVLHVRFPFLLDRMARRAAVVSTGGGAVLRDENWEYMRSGIVVWLTGPPELLSRRALSDGTQKRPLLSQGSDQGDDAYAATVAKLEGILEHRQHLYMRADLHVPLEGSSEDPGGFGATPSVVAHRLLKGLREKLEKERAGREAEAASAA